MHQIDRHGATPGIKRNIPVFLDQAGPTGPARTGPRAGASIFAGSSCASSRGKRAGRRTTFFRRRNMKALVICHPRQSARPALSIRTLGCPYFECHLMLLLSLRISSRCINCSFGALCPSISPISQPDPLTRSAGTDAFQWSSSDAGAGRGWWAWWIRSMPDDAGVA